MTITTVNGVIDALANRTSRLVVDKANLASQTVGRYISLWRSTGQPGQGAIPAAAALCTKALTGSFQWDNPTGGNEVYMGFADMMCSNSAATLEVHDRLCHVGGLLLNVTTAQTITGLDLSTIGGGIAADRRGDADYSDIQWWLEVFTDGGATASNATINVTYNDNTTGNLNALAVGGTIRAGNFFALNGIDPASGKFIRGINSVTLSASTGTAGNFGFTATRKRATLPLPLANKAEVFDWAQLRIAKVFPDSCLFPVAVGATTSSGTFRGGLNLMTG